MVASRDCGVNVPALAYLADHGRFPALSRLVLAGNRLNGIGMKAVLRAGFLAELTHLDLSMNGMGDEEVQLLAAANLGRLRWLSVEANSIGAAGFRALGDSETQPRLFTLRYARNRGGDWWPVVRDRFPGNVTTRTRWGQPGWTKAGLSRTPAYIHIKPLRQSACGEAGSLSLRRTPAQRTPGRTPAARPGP